MSSPISQIRILPADVGLSETVSHGASKNSFKDILQNAVDQVQLSQQDAQKQVTELVSGEGTDLHSATIAVEKADLSFQLMLQVRNKMVQAYEEISRMQF